MSYQVAFLYQHSKRYPPLYVVGEASIPHSLPLIPSQHPQPQCRVRSPRSNKHNPHHHLLLQHHKHSPLPLPLLWRNARLAREKPPGQSTRRPACLTVNSLRPHPEQLPPSPRLLLLLLLIRHCNSRRRRKKQRQEQSKLRLVWLRRKEKQKWQRRRCLWR